MIEGGKGGHIGVEQVDGTKARMQLLVKGDANLLGRMHIGLAHVVHDHNGMQAVDGHLAVYVA